MVQLRDANRFRVSVSTHLRAARLRVYPRLRRAGVQSGLLPGQFLRVCERRFDRTPRHRALEGHARQRALLPRGDVRFRFVRAGGSSVVYSNCVLIVRLSLRKIDRTEDFRAAAASQAMQTAVLTPTDTPPLLATSTQSWKPSQKPSQNAYSSQRTGQKDSYRSTQHPALSMNQRNTQSPPSSSQNTTYNPPSSSQNSSYNPPLSSQNPTYNPSSQRNTHNPPSQPSSHNPPSKPSNPFSTQSTAAPATAELVDLTPSSDGDEAFEASLRPLSVQTDVLQQKLKHLEEFHAETVKYYEKELAAKQRTIHQLTQANREFEKLCVDSVLGESKTEDVLRLRNENEALKRKVREAEERWKRLQKENDELR